MKKPVQVAKKQQLNAVQNKKKAPAKSPVKKGGAQTRSEAFQKMFKAKGGNKNSEDDDDESEDEDFPDNGNGVEDSDSDDVGDDNGQEQDGDESESEENGSNENVEEESDEGPEELSIKREIKEEVVEEQEGVEDDAEKDDGTENGEKISNNKQFDFQNAREESKEHKGFTIYVKKMNYPTSKKQIIEHFKCFGKIVLVGMRPMGNKLDAMVVFADEAASKEALIMHNSILNNANILVSEEQVDLMKGSPERTVIVENTKNLKYFDASRLEKALSKCGEIESMSVLCENNVLAFVHFKDEEGAKKALAIKGETVNGLELKISQFSAKLEEVKKTKVVVKNIELSTTEDELRQFFGGCGNILNVEIKRRQGCPLLAIVTFEEQEGYCKSFLLHGETLRGRPIYLEPNTQHATFAHFKPANKQGEKRPPGMWKGPPPHKKMKGTFQKY